MKTIPVKRLEAINALPAHHLVRVYSYQQPEAIDRIREFGYLTGPNEQQVDEFFKPSYDWMRHQMLERLPHYSGEYPVWAWLKRPSTKNKERRYQENAGVRITAMVPRSRILLSDYDLWHTPLNGSPCTLTEEELDNWEGDPEPTWGMVFDFTPYSEPPIVHWLGPRRALRIQACVDRIYESEIVSIREQ